MYKLLQTAFNFVSSFEQIINLWIPQKVRNLLSGGTVGRSVFNTAPRPLGPRATDPVGPGAGLKECGIFRPHRDSIPEQSSPWRVAVPTELSCCSSKESKGTKGRVRRYAGPVVVALSLFQRRYCMWLMLSDVQLLSDSNQIGFTAVLEIPMS